MPLTEAQIQKLGQNRKRNPPSFYNVSTDEYEIIADTTEDALILIDSAVKQKTAQYLDILLGAHPTKDDYDIITARTASKQTSNLTAALDELNSVVDGFNSLRLQLLGSGSTEDVFAQGMQPLLQSILRGIGPLKNRIDSMRFTRTVFQFAGAKYSSKIANAQRKEWRSWKRVLLVYP